MTTHVLVIEDNEDLAFGLKNNLEIEGYEVDVVHDGMKGVAAIERTAPDLVILDLTLPGMDGFRVLRTIREQGISVPILILTARDAESDKVRGLRLGADDYVTKPFGVLELLARVEAVLRRGGRGASDEGPITFGDVVFNPATREVHRAGEFVGLSPKEFDLLAALLRREGAVAPRGELMKEVWGYQTNVLSRTVDTHIAELRRKLEPHPSTPKHILTVRKQGYRLQR